MRIEFLTQDDPLYILPFFESFFGECAKDFEIVRVSCCPTMGSRPRSQLLRELLYLYGAIGLARLVLRVAFSRLIGLIPLGKDRRQHYSMPQLCRAYGIPFQRIGNPNGDEFIRGLTQRAPDLILSVACPYILKDRLLKLPPLGCVNIHHAPLPQYKGMMPTFWQMYHGEKSVGVTVHYMAAKVDEGATLLQEKLPIEPGESLDHLIRRSKRHGAHCMAKVVRELSSQTEKTLLPLNSQSSYFTFPTKEEIQEFHRRGFRAI